GCLRWLGLISPDGLLIPSPLQTKSNGGCSFRGRTVMFRVCLGATAAVLVLVTVSGCGSARMIQSGPDGGVVAIPSNSNYWPFKYRDSAEKMMTQKCPNGYDIVREEEIVIGQKSTTSEQTDHITPAGFRDGRERTTTSVTTSTRPETEYRITF